jgi:NAD-dependent dihydropyrimidine dehydrogenase PreA subunit
MRRKKLYAVPEPGASNPVIFDPDICDGCNRCLEVCQMDIMIPNPKKGKHPIVIYPGECWYGGCCVAICPRQGAIKLNHPLMNRVRWKRKTTGEHSGL